MSERYVVKSYGTFSSEDADLLSIYDQEDMTYTGFFDTDEEGLAKEICKLCNRLNDELNMAYNEIASLNRYMSVDEQMLMKENIKLRNMLRYQEGVYNLEKKYFAECLLSVIEEYPKSQGLLAYKDLMGW